MISALRLKELEVCGWLLASDSPGVQEFEEDCLHNPPDLHAVADAAGDGLPPAAAGHVHVENGSAFFVGEESTRTSYFVGIPEDMGHGEDGEDTVLLRADDEGAAVVGAANDEKGRRPDLVITGKGLDDFMDNLAILQADDKNSAHL